MLEGLVARVAGPSCIGLHQRREADVVVLGRYHPAGGAVSEEAEGEIECHKCGHRWVVPGRTETGHFWADEPLTPCPECRARLQRKRREREAQDAD